LHGKIKSLPVFLGSAWEWDELRGRKENAYKKADAIGNPESLYNKHENFKKHKAFYF